MIKSLHIILILLFGLISFLITSCDDISEPDQNNYYQATDWDNIKSTTLIYAIASNSLQSDFRADSLEIITAAEDIDLTENAVLLYVVKKTGNPSLQVLSQNELTGEYGFNVIKNYDRNIYSTDPRRINQVINDVMALSKASHNGVIFWSHGTGWRPDSSVHPEYQGPSEDISQIKTDGPIAYSFGEDSYGGTSDFCNIDELASAIPDGFFNYIWFDCCYMGSIEVVYQLRNKANWVVAYPTEIYQYGMPYDLTLPSLAQQNPMLIKAAQDLFNFYHDNDLACTVGVYKTSKLDEIAEEFSKVNTGPAPSTYGMINFSRLKNPAMFDFGEIVKAYGRRVEGWDMQKFNILIQDFIPYKASHNRDFNNRTLNLANYHGISVNLFTDDNSVYSNYYKTLDWYNDTSNRTSQD